MMYNIDDNLIIRQDSKIEKPWMILNPWLLAKVLFHEIISQFYSIDPVFQLFFCFPGFLLKSPQ